LRQGPQAGTCQGCGCGAVSATTCVATVQGWTGSCAGTPIASYNNAQINAYTCGSTPVSDDSWAGVRASFGVTSGTCPANGTPKPSTLSWGNQAVFCRITRTGQGCGTGKLCLPRNVAHATAPLCSQIASGTCAATQATQTWYTGADDGRTCGACKCTASGAGCGNVTVQFGNDWTGTDSPVVVGDGQTVCGYAYSPKAMLTGTPTPATCAASSPLQGTILPLGTTTLCCNP
jgi:hypothetical protein